MNPPNHSNQYQPPGYVVYYADPRCDDLNTRLVQMEHAYRNKEYQAYVQEEAFSDIASGAHRLWVPGKDGRSHLILDADFEKVIHVLVDPVFQKENCYIMYLYGDSRPFILTEQQFNHHSKLIHELVQFCGKTVRLYKSERHTAVLIRQYILSLTEEWFVPFYAGWHCEYGKWRNYLLNGSTHSSLRRDLTNEPPRANTSTGGSASSEHIAAVQFVSLMETIIDPALRGVICLWSHAATLTTFLCGHGYRIAMGLCLYCADSKSYRHLCAILAWYGDPAFSLSMRPQRFIESMVERKDQPLLVFDALNQQKTTSFLLDAVQTGELPPRSAKDSQTLALNSLVTVLSDTVSTISASRYFATVEVAKDALATLPENVLNNLNRYIPDYLLGFNKYVEDHIDNLIEHVSQGIDEINAGSDGSFENLDADGMTTLGIVKGIKQVIADYWRFIAADEDLQNRFNTLLSNEGINALIVALDNAVDSGCAYSDFVESFAVITRRMLSNNQFDLRSRLEAQIDTPYCVDTAGIVYEDECYLYFTREAMQSICQACCVSSPNMLKALKKAALLQGATVNTETSLTRTTIYDNDSSKVVRVYKIERQAIECN